MSDRIRACPKWLMSIGVGILLLVMVFFVNFALVVFDFSHYESQFEELNRVEVTGIEEGELYRITEEILAYLMLQRDDIDIQAVIEGEEQELFTQREIIHMEDVRDLFVGGYMVLFGNIFLLVVVMYLAVNYLSVRHRELFPNKTLSISFLLRRGVLTALGLMAAVAVIFFVGFDFWYNQLHWWLFDNEYWILTPGEHNLITIFPVQFFYNTLVRIVARTGIYLAVIYVISLTSPRLSFKGLNKS